MYIVHDQITDTMIGPFSSEEEAVQFTMEAEDLIADGSQNLSIYEVTEAQEWALDNVAYELVG